MLFKDFIKEEKEKRVVFAFGRMNPPTTGHKALVDKVKAEAKSQGASHEIVLSHSQDPKKNPLTPQQKLTHAKRFFPRTNISVASREHPNLLHHLSRLHAAGNHHLTMIAGDDRKGEYEKLISKYNGVKGPHGFFHFKTHKVVSSGARDPDSEGVEGMSASKMRKHAEENNFKEFKKGIPSHVSDEHAAELFKHVRKNMSVKESRDLREKYLNCEVFNLGETVVGPDNRKGLIVYRGSTYVTVEHANGATVKHWLQDIKEEGEAKELTETAAPIVTYRKTKLNQLPALLMNSQQIKEMQAAPMQVSYLGYTTQHFDMCPGAKSHIESLIARGDRNPKYLLQAIQAMDQMFGIEKAAVSAGFAHQETVHEFTMKLGIAHDTLKLLGAPEHDMLYFHDHIKKMSKLSLHRDNTFANEYGTHIGQPGGVEEEAVVQKIEIRTTDGKQYNKFIRADKLIPDPEEDDDGAGEITKKSTPKNDNNKSEKPKPAEKGVPGWSWDMKESGRKSFSSFIKEVNVEEGITKDTGWKPMEPRKDQYGNPIKPKNVAKRLAKQGMQQQTKKEVKEDTERDINYSPDKDIYDGIDKTIDDQGHPGKPVGLVAFKHFKPTKDPAKETDMHRELAQQTSPAYNMMKKAHKQDM
jgi:hypothetical protein